MPSFDNVAKTRADDTPALSAGAAKVTPGEILAVVGGRGSDKTMLLRLFAGLERLPDDVGLFSREPRLFPWLSVAENVAFGLAHLSAFEREGLTANALARVGLGGSETRRPRELSGGQQQRVAMARYLITRPKLVLMDEPFSALDAATRASLHRHLLALWEESRPSVVVITHDVEEAVMLADRIIVMRPQPGRVFDELDNPLARPRDRLSPAFEAVKREVLRALDRALRDQEPRQRKVVETAGMSSQP